MTKLIVTEKPAQAEKIAFALADNKPIIKTKNSVKYYELTHNKQKILVGCAVGHLFGLAKTKKNKGYPVFDIDWKPKHEIDKHSGYTEKYAKTLKELAKKADEFMVATDFDVEGSVIGHNIIKFLCGKKDAKRMKFSTLTKDELISSYEKPLKHLVFSQIKAGETRHHLDWFYGINLSNALMTSIKNATNRFRIMSTGRVQGPTLKLIVKKEDEIKKFKPETYWEIFLNGSLKNTKIKAKHKKEKFTEKQEVKKILEKTKGKKAFVEKIIKRKINISPPAPFDLTSLQMESYKLLKITPKETSSIAQKIYTLGIISYPRTGSQKLPPSIGYKKIINKLLKNKEYSVICNSLLSKKVLKPVEGKKTDIAHPAIYPTGDVAKLQGKELQLYNLIVRRFLSTFGDTAIKESTRLTIDVNKEKFLLSGSIILEPGWYKIYGKFAKVNEQILPEIEKEDEVKVKSIDSEEKQTQPPKRYTQASIIKKMETLGLGTKATRHLIIDALSQRKYIDGIQIKATPLGSTLINTLEKYSPEIIDEELTKSFEEDMKKIREKKEKEETVINRAKKVLIRILKKFKENEIKIGKELIKASVGEDIIGDCPKCKKGKLKLRRGRFGLFIACDRYKEGCKTTFSIPKGSLTKPTEEKCKVCKYPLILVIRKGKRPMKLCINKDCPSKKVEIKLTSKKCPKCDGKLVLRKGIYGAFYACENYPKCKYVFSDKKTKTKKPIKDKQKKQL
jgi:DNA topoisomerase I